jgi:uncharacterized protein YbjT (DUF2867 family)
MGAADESPVSFLRWHRETEREIEAAGVDYLHLRPNLFVQTVAGGQAASQIAERNVVAQPTGTAAISLVDVRDIAAVAAWALTADSIDSGAVDLTGPEPHTMAQVADELTALTGRPIAHVDPGLTAFAEILGSMGLPPEMVRGLVELYGAYRDSGPSGWASGVSDGVEQALGRPATPLRRSLAALLPALAHG